MGERAHTVLSVGNLGTAEYRHTLIQLHHSSDCISLSCQLRAQAVEAVDTAAAAAGQMGTATTRFVDAQQRTDLALPPGAEWRTVRVHFRR